jgi:hypothetical protein
VPEPAGETPSGEKPIKGDACEWQEPIDNAVRNAKVLADRALAVLAPLMEGGAPPAAIGALLLNNFHTTDPEMLKRIATTYAKIRVALEAKVSYHCVESTNEDCKAEGRGHVMAFTHCTPDADISICGPYFFVAGDDGRARDILHEFAHHAPGMCQDPAYQHEASYKTLKPELAVVNADSYASFASELPVAGAQGAGALPK